jgi:hypothetical protein
MPEFTFPMKYKVDAEGLFVVEGLGAMLQRQASKKTKWANDPVGGGTGRRILFDIEFAAVPTTGIIIPFTFAISGELPVPR